MTYHAHTSTPLGEMILASDGEALTGAWFTGQAHMPGDDELGRRVEVTDCEVLTQAQAELLEYFAGERTVFEVPLAPDGTDFQLAVWAALRDIPFGYTTTYGAISRIVGPGAPAQAVGQAVGRNRIALFIPCHRVVAADGKLTGYAGGLDRKDYLLTLEEPTAEEEGRLF
ncbi:methylated-DNA--[protein]-cysteine S-methyltransferase [Rothia nasimurium]|uniref:methylated-DNA--[protein]-cysteine S-methyltransferase n=1 Tax=Rothia nasimurium TaxID=85336 RepID=UPI002DD68D9E|nr:methylated-DNA--[protein]-cysteine S-methyltransferase [Rothia nasimurium]